MSAEKREKENLKSQVATPEKKEGLSLFGVNKYEIQNLNDINSEIEKNGSTKALKRITDERLSAAKNAVNNELENYLNGYWDPAQKINRSQLEKAYAQAKENSSDSAHLNEHLGFVLLTFLENYDRLSASIRAQRTRESLKVKQAATISLDELRSKLPSLDLKVIQNLGTENTSTHSTPNEEEEEIITPESPKIKKDKKQKVSTEYHGLSPEQKTEITNKYLTTETIEKIQDSRTKQLAEAVLQASSSKEKVVHTMKLQHHIGAKADGAFWKNSLEALLHSSNTRIIEKKKKPETRPVDLDKEKQNIKTTVDSIPTESLLQSYKNIKDSLNDPLQTRDGATLKAYELALIAERAKANKLSLPTEEIHPMDATKDDKSTVAAAKNTTKNNENSLKTFDLFVSKPKNGDSFVTSDGITFKYEDGNHLYSHKNGFAIVTEKSVLTAFQSLPSAQFLAKAIIEEKRQKTSKL